MMDAVLEDLSEAALAASIKANLFAWYDYLGHSPRAEIRDDPQMKWMLTRLTHSFLNAVLRTELYPADVDARIDETLDYFRSSGVTRCAWWAEPGTQPPDLGEYLVRHELIFSEGSTGMAVDLSSLDVPDTLPFGLTIATVSDTDVLMDWVRAGFTSLGGQAEEERDCFELFAGLEFGLPLRMYLGRLDGNPVATSMLFLGAGVAGIYWVATVSAARRRGVGAAMTLAPLREARTLGYRVGILQASPMGESLYRHLGFREYCRLNNYVFRV